MYDAPEAQLACAVVQFLQFFMFAFEEVPFFAVNLKSYGDELLRSILSPCKLVYDHISSDNRQLTLNNHGV